MNKLWQKESSAVSKRVEEFTVGRDVDFDMLLASYDVQGSIAHVRMLAEVGLIAPENAEIAEKGLNEILKEIEAGEFSIAPGVEDIHSQVEFLLTERTGEVGKMIHSGRSRNDQVAVDLKLFLRAQCKALMSDLSVVFETLIKQSEKYKETLMPGYTHLQVAMPSSIGLWLGAYAESLVDDASLLNTAYAMANKNPLGSGAGYGSSFPLKRTSTTATLGFGDLHWNSIYAQMSRGKTEKFVAMAMSSIAATLARLSMDCCLYLSQNFGFIRFPENLTTGSSIMPHKKNPDVFELIRAKCNRIQALPNELNMMLVNLPSGYHRDLQLTKEILFPAIGELRSCMEMMVLMMENLSVTPNLLTDPKYKYVFSVELLNNLVLQGIPFRTAYQEVGKQIEAGDFAFEGSLNHTHEGSIGNLCNDKIAEAFAKELDKMN